MLKFAPVKVNLIAFTTPSSYNKTPHTHYTVSHYEYGPERTISVPRPFANYARELSPTFTTLLTRHTGSLTA